jgi:hypothetical protein
VVVPHQIRNPQVFEIDRVVLAQQGERGLVLKVTPLPLDSLVVAFEQLPCLRRLTRRCARASCLSALAPPTKELGCSSMRNASA